MSAAKEAPSPDPATSQTEELSLSSPLPGTDTLPTIEIMLENAAQETLFDATQSVVPKLGS